MKGRKPKPTELKLIDGNPGHRPIPAGAPVPTAVPDCPAFLPPEAKAEWARFTQELETMGLVTLLDRSTLASYCEDFALWVEAMGHVRARGLVVKTTRGNPIQNPYLAIANAAKERMLKVLELFGGSASARTRIKALEPTTEDAEQKAMFGDVR